MIIKKFIIEKYKSLENIEINLNNMIIPIIGINESGKTSILEAMFAFDYFNDEFHEGKHLKAENRYIYNSTGHKIKAEVLFDGEAELKELMKDLGYNKSTKFHKEVTQLHSEKKSLIIGRDLDKKTYYFENITTDATDNIIKALFIKLPFILYFDDFTDRVPDYIVFPKNYTSDNYDSTEDENHDEWHSFVEEIFNRATQNKTSLSDFLKIKEHKVRLGVLSDVNDRINKDIISDWEKLKILKNELKNENISKLKVKLEYELKSNEEHCFHFNIEDKNYDSSTRFFDIRERSKGFQWFFNFAIKLKYNHKYVGSEKGAIYLLDEPGSYLHALAQEELLNSLNEISKTNTVIYCTHSQYLLNPQIININNIKITVKDNGLISLQNFAEYKNSNRSHSALSPLYDALQMNVLEHQGLKGKDLIITEGIIDYYLLNLLQKFNTDFSKLEVNIIPGAGADNLKDLISFSISWANKYMVMLDSDEKGEEAFKKYAKYFGEKESQKFLKLSMSKKDKGIDIEDYFSASDKKKLCDMYNGKDTKKCIISLFFDTGDKQELFFKNINNETKENIQFLFNQIKLTLYSTK